MYTLYHNEYCRLAGAASRALRDPVYSDLNQRHHVVVVVVVAEWRTLQQQTRSVFVEGRRAAAAQRREQRSNVRMQRHC